MWLLLIFLLPLLGLLRPRPRRDTRYERMMLERERLFLEVAELRLEVKRYRFNSARGQAR